MTEAGDLAGQLRASISDERVLAAIASLPRERFVPGAQLARAYENTALPIACNQTISQPLVVALMTQALKPRPGDIALEVGTGSGYQAAVLSRLCRKVVTLDREPALAERASETLVRLGFDNVEVAVADGSHGWPASAPYDLILVACASPELPSALLEQLAPEGRLIIPLGSAADEHQNLRVYERHEGDLSSRSLFPVRFVPLRTG